MLKKLRTRIALALVGKSGRRGYAGAVISRLTAGWRSPTSSADAEIGGALQTLRGRSRELVRNSSYAKRAKTVVMNNIIGSGIGMQGQVRPKFRERLDVQANDGIEFAWDHWTRAANCHAAGLLHFSDLERVLMGEIFEAGEVFVRKHYRAFGESRVPLGLEVIEAERIADDLMIPQGVDRERYRLGVEVDGFSRPVAYWIRQRHPGDARPELGSSDRLERVPADQIIHLYLVERSPQTRGVPWLHSAMRRLQDMDGYTEAEIVAARGSAAYMAIIKSEQTDDPLGARDEGSTQTTIEMEPGIVQRLTPGDDIVFNNPSRPNPNMDPFLRYLLREVAAGIGVSYESLSRDYSQSNYSSSRLALLDDRDLWRTLQGWFIRAFREPLHREWLRLAVMSRAISSISLEEYGNRPEKFEAVKFKPKGLGWIDPAKEQDAYAAAVRSGFMTRTDVIALTGGGQDIEDIDATREQELDAAKARGLEYETDPEAYMPPEPVAPVAAEPEPPEEEEEDEKEDEESTEEPPARLVSFGPRR